MRIEVGGAQVTESVAELIETVQTDSAYLKEITEGIARLSQLVALDADLSDAEGMQLMRVLQTIMRDYQCLATPPELEDPTNDNPVFSI